jgi:DNA-binding response OmpR family regulator
VQRVLLYTSNHHSPGPIRDALVSCGISLIPCTALETLSNQILRDKPDAILILVDKPSLEIRRFVKTEKPVYVVTSHQQALDRINALKAGVREYYIEPFPLTRLVYDLGSVSYQTPQQQNMVYGPYGVDIVGQLVLYRGFVLPLGKRQFHIFHRLLQAKGSPVSRLQIWESAWSITVLPQLGAIDTAIARLRKRLPPELQNCIRPVYGVGYRLLVPRS